MRNYLLAVVLLSFTAPLAAKDWQISRFYRSSTDHVRVLIVTTMPVTLQCAAQDRSGDPIAVDGPQYIAPPMDEMIIRDFGKSNSVRCWER